MITTPAAFVDYFEGIRKRTLRFLESVPEGKLDFTPNPGKFTLGDLIRHLASTEAMFTEAVLSGEWRYAGHGPEHGATRAEAVAYLERQHAAAMERLRTAEPDVLERKRPTMQGYPVRAWHLLMAMAEHEIHHRSQISQYLVALGLEAPQIFGLKIEQVPGEAAE